MIKLNKNLLLIVALIGGTIGFTNCSSAPTTSNNGNTTAVTNSKPANTTTNTTTTTTTTQTKTETTSGDKVGVPECDEYIAKYEACLTSIGEKYPQVQPSLKSAFENQREGFKKAAANPESKATLASTCKQAIDSAKQSTSAYACKW